MTAAKTALRLVVRGRVQGVFYRDWTVQTARRLGVSGWVRNCPDGTVEAWLEGAEATVRRMLAAMRDGPPAARVDAIEDEQCGPEGYGDFRRC